MNIFFDLDGTLLDTRERYYRVYADILKEMGFEPLNREMYLRYKLSLKSEKSILEYSKAESIFNEYDTKRIHRLEKPEYLELDTIWPELQPVINYVSKKNTCSLITLRKDQEALIRELDQLGVKDSFFLVLQPGGGFNTPGTPELKTRIMRENFSKSKMNGWIIGNSDDDVLAGREFGLRTAIVTYGMQDAEVLVKLSADHSFSSPRQLAIWLLNR